MTRQRTRSAPAAPPFGGKAAAPQTAAHPVRGKAAASKTAAAPGADFEPATPRYRHDGWTPERQIAFIEALAECGCVDAACRSVGMGTSSAYQLRNRLGSKSFRQAWDAALDMAVERLSSAAFSRAIHGVTTPIFFKGEQIGERRRYDERLTQFLLRYRDPVRYGAWLDDCEARRHPEAPAVAFAEMLDRVAVDAYARDAGERPPRHPDVVTREHISAAERVEAEERAAQARADAADRAEREREQREADAEWEAALAKEDAKCAAASATRDAAGRHGAEACEGGEEGDAAGVEDDPDVAGDQDWPEDVVVTDFGPASARDVARGSSTSVASEPSSPPASTRGSAAGAPVTPGFRPRPRRPSNAPVRRVP